MFFFFFVSLFLVLLTINLPYFTNNLLTCRPVFLIISLSFFRFLRFSVSFVFFVLEDQAYFQNAV